MTEHTNEPASGLSTEQNARLAVLGLMSVGLMDASVSIESTLTRASAMVEFVLNGNVTKPDTHA